MAAARSILSVACRAARRTGRTTAAPRVTNSAQGCTRRGNRKQARRGRAVCVRAHEGDGPGPVCVVTGASRGIGRAIALELGMFGARVVVNYASSSGAAEEVKAQIEEAGGEAIIVAANVANRDEVAKLFDETMAKFGQVDVLVNNAGITRDTLMMRMKPEQWQDVIDLNLSGVFHCTQAATKLMGKVRRDETVGWTIPAHGTATRPWPASERMQFLPPPPPPTL